jgi:hypothetical protein
MARERSVIIIPGLGDNEKEIRWITGFWKRRGLIPVVHAVGWRDGQGFPQKLAKLISLVDKLDASGFEVSVVGTSAGGSAALNTYWARRNVVKKVVNLCGRLRVGENVGRRSFVATTSTSMSFAQSVIMCEKNLGQLSWIDKKKILTLRAWGFDELVPADTSIVTGAANIVIPLPEHLLAISSALTISSKPLLNFLLD